MPWNNAEPLFVTRSHHHGNKEGNARPLTHILHPHVREQNDRSQSAYAVQTPRLARMSAITPEGGKLPRSAPAQAKM